MLTAISSNEGQTSTGEADGTEPLNEQQRLLLSLPKQMP